MKILENKKLQKISAEATLLYFHLYRLSKKQGNLFGVKISEKELKEITSIKSIKTNINKLVKSKIIDVSDAGKKIYILGEYIKCNTNIGDITSLVLYIDSIDEEIEKIEVVKKKTKNFGPEIKEILDFYYKLFQVKFGHKPIISPVVINSSLKTLLKQAIAKEFIMATIPIYLELNDRWLIERDYPLQNIGKNLPLCRKVLSSEVQQSGIGEEEYYNYKINKIKELWTSKK